MKTNLISPVNSVSELASIVGTDDIYFVIGSNDDQFNQLALAELERHVSSEAAIVFIITTANSCFVRDVQDAIGESYFGAFVGNMPMSSCTKISEIEDAVIEATTMKAMLPSE